MLILHRNPHLCVCFMLAPTLHVENNEFPSHNRDCANANIYNLRVILLLLLRLLLSNTTDRCSSGRRSRLIERAYSIGRFRERRQNKKLDNLRDGTKPSRDNLSMEFHNHWGAAYEMQTQHCVSKECCDERERKKGYGR